MGKVLQGGTLEEIVVDDFRVLLCTGRKNSTVWNYGKEVCQCIPNIVIFKYEICMKHV